MATVADPARADLVVRALADPTRRRILDALRRGESTVGEMADRFPMTRFGVRKHLLVLREAGLVIVTARGRERRLRLNPAPFRALYRRWVRPFEEPASDALLRLRAHVERGRRGADVGDVKRNGFGVAEVVAEVPIAAPPDRVWRALTEETSEWWDPGFFSSPRAKRMVVEARLGGRVFEDWGDGEGLVWYTVIGLDRGRVLTLSGDLWPQNGPARLYTEFRLEEKDGGTVVRLHEHIFGQVGEDSGPSMEKGWTHLLGKRLKPHVEG